MANSAKARTQTTIAPLSRARDCGGRPSTWSSIPEQYLRDRDVVAELSEEVEQNPPVRPMVAKPNATYYARTAFVDRIESPREATIGWSAGASPNKIRVRLDRVEYQGSNRADREHVSRFRVLPCGDDRFCAMDT